MARNTAIMGYTWMFRSVSSLNCYLPNEYVIDLSRAYYADLFGHNAIFSPVPAPPRSSPAVVLEIQLINIGYAVGFVIKTYLPYLPGHRPAQTTQLPLDDYRTSNGISTRALLRHVPHGSDEIPDNCPSEKFNNVCGPVSGPLPNGFIQSRRVAQKRK